MPQAQNITAKNINATFISTPDCAINITWELTHAISMESAFQFQVICYNNPMNHIISLLVMPASNQLHFYTTQLGGFFYPSSYNCCVLVVDKPCNIDESLNRISGLCKEVLIPDLSTDIKSMPQTSNTIGDVPETHTPSIYNITTITKAEAESPDTFFSTNNYVPQTSKSALNTVGGVLGFIIVVLLVLLSLSGIALVCLLRPDLRWKRKLSAR